MIHMGQQGCVGKKLGPMPDTKKSRRFNNGENEVQLSPGKKSPQISHQLSIIPDLGETGGLDGGFIELDRFGRLQGQFGPEN